MLSLLSWHTIAPNVGEAPQSTTSSVSAQLMTVRRVVGAHGTTVYADSAGRFNGQASCVREHYVWSTHALVALAPGCAAPIARDRDGGCPAPGVPGVGRLSAHRWRVADGRQAPAPVPSQSSARSPAAVTAWPLVEPPLIAVYLMDADGQPCSLWPQLYVSRIAPSHGDQASPQAIVFA